MNLARILFASLLVACAGSSAHPSPPVRPPPAERAASPATLDASVSEDVAFTDAPVLDASVLTDSLAPRGAFFCLPESGALSPDALTAWLRAHGQSARLPRPPGVPAEALRDAPCAVANVGAGLPEGLCCAYVHEVPAHYARQLIAVMLPGAGAMEIAWSGVTSAGFMYDGDEIAVALRFSADGQSLSIAPEASEACAPASREGSSPRATPPAAAQQRRWEREVCAVRGRYILRDGRYLRAP